MCLWILFHCSCTQFRSASRLWNQGEEAGLAKMCQIQCQKKASSTVTYRIHRRPSTDFPIRSSIVMRHKKESSHHHYRPSILLSALSAHCSIAVGIGSIALTTFLLLYSCNLGSMLTLQSCGNSARLSSIACVKSLSLSLAHFSGQSKWKVEVSTMYCKATMPFKRASSFPSHMLVHAV